MKLNWPKSKGGKIFLGVIIYFILIIGFTRVAGVVTIAGSIALGVYLFTKNESFKQKNKAIKGLVSIGLAFFILIGAVFTSITRENIEKTKVASEKTQIEQQDKQKASEEQAKKAEEEKAKQQAEEQAKKDAEENAKKQAAEEAEAKKKAEEEAAKRAEEEKARAIAEKNNSVQAESTVITPANNTANVVSNVSVNSNDSRTVYWVPKGKSYHYNKGCPTLARSKTILEGPLSECPKSDPCDKCVH